MVGINPTYIINAWVGGENRVIFREIRNVPAYLLFRQFPIQKKFIGLRATVIVVTDDQGITDPEKQDSAVAFMTGKYTEITVDLDRCDVVYRDGVNLIENPR